MPPGPRSATHSHRHSPGPRPAESSRPGPFPTIVVALVAALVASVCWLTAPVAAVAAEPPGVWPLDPRPAVVHGFDPPDVRWGSGHRGVDLAGRLGQPVRAALPGTVSFAGRVAGRGVMVVDHGATRTTYEPVTASVPRGTPVGRGQVIGTLAWFGTHCLPAACLHWGLRAGDTYLDPLQLVGGPVPVRLLPLGGSPLDGSLLQRSSPWEAFAAPAGPSGAAGAATSARSSLTPHGPAWVAVGAVLGARAAPGLR